MSEQATETTAPETAPLAEALESLTPATETTQASEVDFITSITSELEEVPAVEQTSTTETTATEESTTEVVETKSREIADKPPGKQTASAIETWGEIKTEAKNLRAERDQLQAQILELQTKVSKHAEIEEKAKLFEEADRELAISRVEATQEFKNVVIKPLEAIGNAAEELAKRNEIDPDQLYSALYESDTAKRNKALEAVVGGLSDLDKYSVYEMARDTQTIRAREKELHERATDARKELETKQQAEAEQTSKQTRANYEAALKRTADALKSKLPFEALADGETADGAYQALLEKAQSSDFNTASPDVQAYSVFAGLLVPRLVKQLHAESKRRASAETRIAELTKAKPSAGPTKPAAQPVPTGNDFLAGVGTELGW